MPDSHDPPPPPTRLISATVPHHSWLHHCYLWGRLARRKSTSFSRASSCEWIAAVVRSSLATPRSPAVAAIATATVGTVCECRHQKKFTSLPSSAQLELSRQAVAEPYLRGLAASVSATSVASMRHPGPTLLLPPAPAPDQT